MPNLSEYVLIPVRSEQQAMDWSLVLTSQEIPSTLLRSDDTAQWFVAIQPRDRPRALKAIGQYQWENRQWRWRELPLNTATFHWGVLNWCGLLGLWYWLDVHSSHLLTSRGMMDNMACLTGEWWRLFTAVTLHGDVGHLASNLTIGFLLLGLAMALYGSGWALATSFLAGALGNLASLGVYSLPHYGLGASGMVMGALGLLAVHALAYRQYFPHPRHAIMRLVTGGMLFVLLGLNPQSDMVAHFGGFVAGSLLGFIVLRWPATVRESGRLNGALIFITVALVVLTWSLAW